MKGHTNNPNGRPIKGEEKRKGVAFRLQPSTIERIRKAAEENQCSQSDIIEALVTEVLIMSKSTQLNLSNSIVLDPKGLNSTPLKEG